MYFYLSQIYPGHLNSSVSWFSHKSLIPSQSSYNESTRTAFQIWIKHCNMWFVLGQTFLHVMIISLLVLLCCHRQSPERAWCSASEDNKLKMHSSPAHSHVRGKLHKNVSVACLSCRVCSAVVSMAHSRELWRDCSWLVVSFNRKRVTNCSRCVASW